MPTFDGYAAAPMPQEQLSAPDALRLVDQQQQQQQQEEQQGAVESHHPSGPPAAAPLSYEASFIRYFNSKYAWSDTLIDCLTIAGFATRCFVRGFNAIPLSDLAAIFSWMVIVTLHMLWRWLLPKSYCRWRHVSTTLLTLCATCTPRFWRRRLLGLARAPEDRHNLLGLGAAARVVLVSSYTLQLSVYGMGRPTPFWIKIPTHTVAMAVVTSHATSMCATPVFQQRAVADWVGIMYGGMRALASLLPLPFSPLLPDPSRRAACGAVVTFVHVTLGHAAPLMVALVLELRARQRHALQYPQHAASWRRRQHQPWWRFATWLSSRQGMFQLVVADLVAAAVTLAALWDVVVAVRGEVAVGAA